jgi:hypothetical protein
MAAIKSVSNALYPICDASKSGNLGAKAKPIETSGRIKFRFLSARGTMSLRSSGSGHPSIVSQDIPDRKTEQFEAGFIVRGNYN